MTNTIPISILELALITQDNNASATLEKTKEVAQLADRLGYKRFWLAEHHNMAHVASSATVVLIGYIASQTQNIRVGSGGIMLPNHSPLIVAEQFGTLETLYPNRIDLGLGRTPRQMCALFQLKVRRFLFGFWVRVWTVPLWLPLKVCLMHLQDILPQDK
jgi:luciferase family oxidoreductase group 1